MNHLPLSTIYFKIATKGKLLEILYFQIFRLRPVKTSAVISKCSMLHFYNFRNQSCRKAFNLETYSSKEYIFSRMVLLKLLVGSDGM